MSIDLPGVSVIVCTVDRPDALDRCLRALLDASWPPAEVVVVDQGGVAHAGTDPRVRHVHARNEGVSRARNLGAAEAAHDLLAFTDDDCVAAPGWLAALTSAYSDGVDGVTGRVLPLPGGQGVPVSSRTSGERRTFRGPESVPWEIGTGGNLSLRRAAFERVGGFDETLGPGTPGRAAEDVDLLHRVVTAGSAIVYEPDAVVYHELKTRTARLQGRFGYGFGLGTFLARRQAAGKLDAPALRRRYASQLGRRAASAAWHGDLWPLVEGALTGAGMVAASVRRVRR